MKHFFKSAGQWLTAFFFLIGLWIVGFTGPEEEEEEDTS